MAIAGRAVGSDVRFEGEGDDGLGDGRQQEGPGPLCIWDVHSALPSRDWGKFCGEALAVVVAAWLGLIGLRLWWVEAAIERLASEEGCSCLVVRNFGGSEQPVHG